MRLLLHLAGAEPWPAELVEATADEPRDDTREAIDAVWCEAPVTFEAGSALGACGKTSRRRPTAAGQWCAWRSGSAVRRGRQMDFLNSFLFEYYVYIAGTVFLLGSLVRFDMSQYTWKTNSSQLLDNSRLFLFGSVLFHAGVIFLFFGHLVGLLMPHSLYPYLGLTPGIKQIIAMVTGGIAGIAALVGGSMLLHRRLMHPRVRAHSTKMDIFVLLLLYVQLVLGMGTIAISIDHLDGHVMVLLSDWAQHVLTFRPGAAEYLAEVHWVYKLHIFLGVTTFLIFPFTRLVHIWSLPATYVARQYQIVRQRHL